MTVHINLDEIPDRPVRVRTEAGLVAYIREQPAATLVAIARARARVQWPWRPNTIWAANLRELVQPLTRVPLTNFDALLVATALLDDLVGRRHPA